MNGSTITIGQLIHAAQLLEGNNVAIAMEPTSAFYKLGGTYLSNFKKFHGFVNVVYVRISQTL